MECVGQQVMHQKFGVGKIREIAGNTMTIYFQDYGARTFLYPQGFDRFLTASDPEFAIAVQNDLNAAWETQADEELERRKRIETELAKGRAERAEARKTTKKKSR